jgi:hypothetical protein
LLDGAKMRAAEGSGPRPNGWIFDTCRVSALRRSLGRGGPSVAQAAYLPVDRNNTRVVNGKALPSSFTFMPPAIDYARGGFWSVTTYNEAGWLAEDKAAISNTEATPNADGSYKVKFNDPGAPNNLDTPAPFIPLLRVDVPPSVDGIISYFATDGRALVIE